MRPDRAAGAHRGGRLRARLRRPVCRSPWRALAGPPAIAGAVRPAAPSHAISASRRPAHRSSACCVWPLAPRFSSHRSLARMVIPSRRPAQYASRQTTELPCPVQLPHETRVGRHVESDRDSPVPAAENQCSGKSRRAGAADARKRGGKSDQTKAPRHSPAPAQGTQSLVKSGAVARGRRRPAPDAADATCRLPERLDRPDPWSPRRRPRGRSSRRASGHVLPRH